MFFFSLVPMDARDPPIVLTALVMEVTEPLCLILARSVVDAARVSLAFTVNPSLTCETWYCLSSPPLTSSSPLYSVLFLPGLHRSWCHLAKHHKLLQFKFCISICSFFRSLPIQLSNICFSSPRHADLGRLYTLNENRR